jgi:ATP-binding cassette subfamily C protein LapB
MLSGHDSLEKCLLHLAQHFQLPVSEATVRSFAVGINQGMTVEQFMQVAQRLGMGCALSPQDLATVTSNQLPLVLMQQDGHALVLMQRLSDDLFDVMDARYGNRSVEFTLAHLQADYSGMAIQVRSLVSHTRPVSAAAAEAQGHWFWSALKQSKWSYAQVATAAVLINFLALTTSIFTMVVYDRILPSQAVDSLIALTFGVMVALVVDFIIKSLRAVFIDDAGHHADQLIGQRIFDQMLDMKLVNRKGSAGGFANTLREFETLREFFTSATLATLVDLPFAIFFLVVIYMVAGPLGIVPLIAVPAIILLGVVVQPLLKRYTKEAYEQGQSKQGVLVEAISGLETVKTSGAGPLLRERWESCIRDQSSTGMRSRRVSHLVVNGAGFIQQAAQILMVVYGVFLIVGGQISMGSLIASTMLCGRALAPLAQLTQILTRMNQARTSYQSLDSIMRTGTDHAAGRHYVSRPRLSGDLELRDVSFRYPDQQQNALNQISLRIQPGEKVAILGRIGSGKSTVARLLLGLYEQDEGLVLADNTDLRQINPSDLRANIGVVQQDIWLVSGTLRQNIAIGDYRPSDAAILEASKVAGVHEFSSQHPLGYDMVLGEKGEGLSGGQKQAITIARALVGNPPILVMDEPTSMMDVQTEKQVLQSLKKHCVDMTVIIITHRTSLLELVDRVIVLDKGKVVADGPKAMVMQTPSTLSAPHASANAGANAASPSYV